MLRSVCSEPRPVWNQVVFNSKYIQYHSHTHTHTHTHTQNVNTMHLCKGLRLLLNFNKILETYPCFLGILLDWDIMTVLYMYMYTSFLLFSNFIAFYLCFAIMFIYSLFLKGSRIPRLLISKQQTGTKESITCSGRGICDPTSGYCSCSVGYTTSNGYNALGTRGDCGRVTDNIQTCPGLISCSGHGIYNII